MRLRVLRGPQDRGPQSRGPRLVAVAMVGLLAVGAASCAGEDQMGSPSHRMREWVSGTTLGEFIGTLVADNARIPKTVHNGTGAVHAACGALEDDAEQANSSLPSPDYDVTLWLTEAYGLEGTASTECYNAGSTDKSLLAKAYKDTAKANALYLKVMARIRSLDGVPVSTTTTTDNNPISIFG
jgi:hypothetical protein